jgi:hypothetical protein
MTGFTLYKRTRLSIELALSAGNDDPVLFSQQEASAQQLGLTGAEIDAARRGWSFGVRTSVAVALAIASSEQEQLRQRQRALKAGLTMEACREIEHLAARFLALSSTGVEIRV